MRVVDSIAKKRDGLPLTAKEIQMIVRGAASGSIPDEQLGALLMAIRIRGMDSGETAALSLAMAKSGDTADLRAIRGAIVDKHSTGGVGDTTTLIAVPLAAACGAKIAKMSGRSLGHTGGTLDKLWAIPGTNTELTIEELIEQVNAIGCAVIGQTGELAPADKKLYALRDITATVDSLPLIASSILSKKIAAGANAIVLDVKTGSGALMREFSDASALAHTMVDIGKRAGRRVIALITDMNQPLGTHVGNALEVREAVDILAGRVTGGALMEMSSLIAAYMVLAGEAAKTIDDAKAKVATALQDGSGLAKLRAMIEAQGGDARCIDDTDLLPKADAVVPVPAEMDGTIQSMRCDAIGLAAQMLGAGRARKEDAIDSAVGLVMNVRIGDRVEKGQPLAHLHARGKYNVRQAAKALRDAISVGDEAAYPPPLLYEIIE
jgi:pyrimidine-nucleoside phosphorylase